MEMRDIRTAPGAGPRGDGAGARAGGRGALRGAWGGSRRAARAVGPDEKVLPGHAPGPDAGSAPAEYGVAIGAFSEDDLAPARRLGLPFWGRSPIAVDPIPSRRRDDAAIHAQNLLRNAAQNEAGRTGRREGMSGGLVARESGGDWKWITRIEVSGVYPPPPGSGSHVHAWKRLGRRRPAAGQPAEIAVCAACGMRRTTMHRGGRARVSYSAP